MTNEDRQLVRELLPWLGMALTILLFYLTGRREASKREKEQAEKEKIEAKEEGRDKERLVQVIDALKEMKELLDGVVTQETCGRMHADFESALASFGTRIANFESSVNERLNHAEETNSAAMRSMQNKIGDAATKISFIMGTLKIPENPRAATQDPDKRS